MRRITTEQARRFLITPADWELGQKNEENSDFYWSQLRKLNALGFEIQGGCASRIFKATDPNHAVAVTFWVLSAFETLVKKGFGYYDAYSLLTWLCEVVLESTTKDQQLRDRLESIFGALGFLEIEEPGNGAFYGHFLTGMQEVLSHMHLTQHHRQVMKAAGVQERDFSLLVVKSMRADQVTRYTKPEYRRDGWETAWVDDAVTKLHQKFTMSPEVAVDFLQMVVIGVRRQRENCRFKNAEVLKTELQDFFSQIDIELNEPGTGKFFGKLLGGILAAIDAKKFSHANI